MPLGICKMGAKWKELLLPRCLWCLQLAGPSSCSCCSSLCACASESHCRSAALGLEGFADFRYVLRTELSVYWVFFWLEFHTVSSKPSLDIAEEIAVRPQSYFRFLTCFGKGSLFLFIYSFRVGSKCFVILSSQPVCECHFGKYFKIDNVIQYSCLPMKLQTNE